MNSTFVQIAQTNAAALNQFHRGYNEKAVLILLDALRMIQSVASESEHNNTHDNSIISLETSSASVYSSPDRCERQQPATYEGNIKRHQFDKHEQDHGYCKFANTGFDSSLILSSSPSSYAIRPLRDGNNKSTDTISVGGNSSRSLYDKIYNNAFLLTHDVPVAVAETAAVLSYNLALILHREGLKTGKSVALIKALQLYEQAYELLGHTDEVLCYQSSSVLVILTAAICTNVTQIRNDLHLSCYNDSVITADRLRELVTFMECEQYVRQQDLDFFEVNIFFLSLVMPLSASAA